MTRGSVLGPARDGISGKARSSILEKELHGVFRTARNVVFWKDMGLHILAIIRRHIYCVTCEKCFFAIFK